MWIMLAFYGAVSFSDGQWISDHAPQTWAKGFRTEMTCYEAASRKLRFTAHVAAPIVALTGPGVTVVCTRQGALTS